MNTSPEAIFGRELAKIHNTQKQLSARELHATYQRFPHKVQNSLPAAFVPDHCFRTD
jgi:hypothetical protein